MSTNTNAISLSARNEASWDPSVRRGLEKVRNEIPRYLFRAWAKSSGGSEKFNTPERIIPGAYFEDRDCVPGRSMFRSLSQARFAKMTQAHLGLQKVPTQFSSWTQHLSDALRYGQELDSGFQSEADVKNAHISVIDTEVLRGTNPIFYVPDLDECFETEEFSYENFDHEYLAHGIIENSVAHRTVPLSLLKDMGLLMWFPTCLEPNYGSEPGRLSPSVFPVDMDWMTILSNMSIFYRGPAGFHVVFCIALLCLHRVDEHLFANGVPQRFLTALGSRFSFQSIPDWSMSLTIMTDLIIEYREEDEYGDMKQMIRLMRAIENSRGRSQR